MEGYTDNSQILNYNSPPPLFFLSYMWIILRQINSNNTPKMFI